MRKGTIRNILLGLVLIFCSLNVWGQDEAYSSYSPYSMYGVGDISRFGTAYNRSMGGVGIATRDRRNINILNPAAVTERDIQSFMLDFSLAQGNRYYAQGDMRSANNTFNVNNIIISFPVWKSFAMYGGLSPYSSLGYNISAWETDPAVIAMTGPILNTVKGYGSLSKLFLGGGFVPFKGFSIGGEAQYIFGRPVSHNENAGILMMHDNDGLPAEVILMLLTYGIENKKGMRYIEAMGKSWANEGIFTAQQADEKIRRLDESRDSWHKVQTILGLEFRSPSSSEEEIYTNWIKVWKFSDEMIKEAYDRCINAIGKYRASYVNSILMRWYQNGIKTIEQANAESKAKPKKAKNGDNAAVNSSFDVDELDDLAMFDD